MKASKSFFIVILGLVLVFSTVPVIKSSAQWQETQPMYFPTDINGHWANEVLTDLVHADIVKGYPNGDGTVDVKPNNPITRADFVTLLVRALGLKANGAIKTFWDVPTGQYYTEPIQIAASLGIIGGVGNNEFQPYRQIQRDELAAVVVRAFSSSVNFEGEPRQFPDVPDYWGKPYIETASKAGIITGNEQGQFTPYSSATRAEALVMLHRSLHKQLSNLPREWDIHDVIMGSHDLSLYNSGSQYDQILQSAGQYSAGFYQARTKEAAEHLKKLAATGVNTQIVKWGSSTVWSITRYDNFAVVKLWDWAFGFDGTIKNIDGYVYLRKMPEDGSWKLYSYRPINKNPYPWETADPITLLLSKPAVGQIVSRPQEPNVEPTATSDAETEKITAILKNMSTKMADLESFQVHHVETGTGGTTDETVDYFKNPFTYHFYGTYTYNGQTRPLLDMYLKDGIRYERDQYTGKWDSWPITYEMNISNLLPQPKLYGNEYKLAPYLNLSEDGDTYSITGTITGADYGKLFPINEMNWSLIRDYEYSFKIDKNSYLLISQRWINNESSGQSSTSDISFQNINNVAPIQIPESAFLE